jgi:hypothetical protein
MQATLSVRRINLLSVFLVAVAMVLGIGVGAAGEVLLGAHPQIGVSNPSPSPLPAECLRLGGPRC